VRNFRVGDPDFQKELAKGMDATFCEDNVMCTAVQHEQEVTGVRQYTWLAIDAGPARVRRLLEQMAAAEESPGAKAKEMTT
jgi:vanillate O-demethylase monooxygenase subunit